MRCTICSNSKTIIGTSKLKKLSTWNPNAKHQPTSKKKISTTKKLVVSLVSQSCPTLRGSMDCSTKGFLIHHHSKNLLKLMSIESVIPSNHLILCCSLLLLPSIFPKSGSFPMSQFFTSGGQRIGVSASLSVFPMNIQDWFPLELTGWISLHSKGLLRVFSNTTIQKDQFFSTRLPLKSNTHIHTWLLEKP